MLFHVSNSVFFLQKLHATSASLTPKTVHKYPPLFPSPSTPLSLRLFLFLFLFPIPFWVFFFLFLVESSMASRMEALNLEVLEMISTMEKKGMVDDRFGRIREMRNTSNPFPLLELIPTFNKDAYSILREISAALGKTDLDYGHLEELCLKMEGKTSSIGACRMARACSRLCQATDEKSRDGCLNAFEILKNEYLSLNWMLEWVTELERRILSLETE